MLEFICLILTLKTYMETNHFIMAQHLLKFTNISIYIHLVNLKTKT